MAEQIIVNKNLSDEEIYKTIIPQIENLINADDALISSFANFTAALKEAFDKISWIGFYFLKDNKLVLGPFQGKIACTEIELGKGVCGTSALKKETIIVENVNEFPGHIVCDSESKSEIVIPLLKDNNVIGVLDLDSYEYSAFNEIDKIYLENLCNLLMKKIRLNQLHNLIV
ncbi:GAF domain-containing protein [Rosettibacter firmus]|uniref:GAF domain-containing protein n=1 Tax=Rosettibacter firmus TaxID=3111522 RepID=UPI00336BE64C